MIMGNVGLILWECIILFHFIKSFFSIANQLILCSLEEAAPQKELSKPRRTAAEQRAYLDRLVKPRDLDETSPTQSSEAVPSVAPKEHSKARRTAAEQRAYLDQLLKPRELDENSSQSCEVSNAPKEHSKPKRTAAEQRAYLDQLLKPRELEEVSGAQTAAEALKELSRPRRAAAAERTAERGYLDLLLDALLPKELPKPRRTAAEQRAYLDRLAKPRDLEEIANAQKGEEMTWRVPKKRDTKLWSLLFHFSPQ